MYTLTQKWSFCFGHRLLKHAGKCRNLHGHTATVEIELQFDALQESGMAMDFLEIKSRLGSWIDSELDHQLLLYEGDPLCASLTQSGESFRPVPFHPTAEGIAQAIFDAARTMDLPVRKVTLWESDKSAATYSE